MDASTWLITGASSGLGCALSDYVLNQGDRVVPAATTLEATRDLAEGHPDTGLALALDVTHPEQRADAIRQAELRFGAIDVLVNNAGIDFIGAVKEQDEDDCRRLFEANFFGPVAMLRLVLPGMHERRRGTIRPVRPRDDRSGPGPP